MVNQKVGAVYEIALADVGYMLADNPNRPVRRQTGVLDTQPPGSDEPLSERIGRYDFIGASDWTGGEGQELADRPASDATRYEVSRWIDPFEPGRLTLNRTPEQLITSTYTGAGGSKRAVVAGTTLYVHTAANQLTSLATPTSATSAFNPGLAFDIFDVASDGEYWYACDGLTIRRNNTAADPAANWSTEDVTEIEWCTDRLIGIDSVASPEEIISFSPTGTGTVLAMTHGVDFTLRGLCGGDGFVWYGANRTTSSHIRYWQVDSSPINTGNALTLPPGESVDALFFYQGNVFIATKLQRDITHVKIYRAVPSDGLLTPQLVVDLPNSTAYRTGFAGLDRFVAFTWGNMMGGLEAGIAVTDLETGGYARWQSAPGLGNAPAGLVSWYGQFGFSIVINGANGGWWFADDAADYHSGALATSLSDLATPALKHLDEIVVSTLPLPASTSVQVEYSIDGGTTYTVAATFSTAGATRHSVELATAVRASAFKLRVALTPTASAAPTVTALIAKTHTTGIVDEIIELPINCEDHIADVNGTAIAEDSGPNKGMERYRALQALIGTKVAFQDIDWKMPSEQTTTLVEVVGVESTHLHVFNQNRNLSDVTAHVAVVSLRRPYTA